MLTVEEINAMTESESYRLYLDAWRAFGDWWDWWDKKRQREEWERGGKRGRKPVKHDCAYTARRDAGANDADSPDPLSEIVSQQTHENEMYNALRHLGIQGRVWGMNVEAVDNFMGRVHSPVQRDFSELKDALQHFFHQFQDESEAQWIRAKQERQQQIATRQNPAGVKVDPAAMAVAVLKDHPDWSTRKIAKSVGCAPSTLLRNEMYRKTREAFASGPPPKGRKDADGNIEAFDDDSDNDDED